MTGNLGQFEADWWRPVSESSLLLTEAIHEVGAGGSQRCDEHSLFLPIVGKRMMQEVARGQPNGLAAFDNGADDVGGQEGIADCLAHAVRWDGIFGGNLLIGFACFDSVEPGEGVGDIAQECAVDGFRGVAQNELGLDTASAQAERCENAECILANAVGSRILRKYVDYYHSRRTHLSLEKDAPEPRRVESPAMGKVRGIPKVGGLHHHYTRRAA